MPFVTADACRTLRARRDRPRWWPPPRASSSRFGLYAPAALDVLRAAGPDTPLTRTVEALDPARVALPPGLVRSVNTPAELAEAEAQLA